MRFTVVLSYFVRFLYVILCGFAVFVLSLRPPLSALEKMLFFGNWGPFLESLGNFSGPKSNIHIEI